MLGIVHLDVFTLLEAGARNALVPRDAKRIDCVCLPSRGIDDEFLGREVGQVHRAGLGLHHRAGIGEDVLDQAFKVGERKEIPRGKEQGAVALRHGEVFHAGKSGAEQRRWQFRRTNQRRPLSSEASPPS